MTDAFEDDWTSDDLGDDLEEAYRRALEANAAVEWEIGAADVADGTDDASDGLEPGGHSTAGVAEADHPATIASAETAGLQLQPEGGANSIRESSADAVADADEIGVGHPGDAAAESAGQHSVASDEATDQGPPASRVSAAQVIEAALFVGGAPLATKKLYSLLRDDHSRGLVEEAIDELNRRYARQRRPYEIRLGEGGYRMTLRPEFDRVRNRVYGLGPKEVKLSQEALEVLALVAYRQPVSQQQIEEACKKNAGGLLRQLLRRELVVIERPDKKQKDVQYRTTARFLSLFGLADIDELPRADELDLK